LGGLSLFGFNGLILGPIILVLFFSATDVFKQVYGNKAATEGSKEKDQAGD